MKLWTEEEVIEAFHRDIAPEVPKNDKPALREAFNNWTDYLCKSGHISAKIYNSITLED